MRILLALSLVLALPLAALASGHAPSPEGPGGGTGQPQDMREHPIPEDEPAPAVGVVEVFSMPSGNIGCVYIPEGGTATYRTADGGPELSCDRVEPKYLRAVFGRSGRAVILTDVADRGCCGAAAVLSYGTTWRGGPFTCFSERTGLRCERDDGPSFFLSRARVTAN